MKQRSSFSLALAVALLFLLAAAPVYASTLTINESGLVFDNIQALGFGPGATFNGTGLSSFTAGTWLVNLHSPTWAEATASTPQSNINFVVDFTTTGTGFVDFYAFSAGILVDSARFDWAPGGFTQISIPSFGAGATAQYAADVAAATPTPEPATMFMAGGALLGVGIIRRRRKLTRQ